MNDVIEFAKKYEENKKKFASMLEDMTVTCNTLLEKRVIEPAIPKVIKI